MLNEREMKIIAERRLTEEGAIRAQLAASGASRTAVVTPDAEALTAIGKNVLDPKKRADAARTGLRQAAEVVEKVRRAWTA